VLCEEKHVVWCKAYLVSVNSAQCICVRIEGVLQRYHNNLKAVLIHSVSDVSHNLGDIVVVQRRIDFIQHEEGRRLVAVDGKQQSQRSHRLFASRKLFDIAEPLQRWHGIVFDSAQVRLFGIL